MNQTIEVSRIEKQESGTNSQKIQTVETQKARDNWVIKFRENFRKATIPRFYSPHLHVAGTIIMLGSACIYSIYSLRSVNILEWLTIPLALVYSNIGVFLVHRFLHRRYSFFEYPYKIHTKYHHRFFTDTKIEYEKFRDFYIVLFPAHVVGSFTFLYLPVTGFLLSFLFPMNIVYLYAFTLSFYFLLYETVHFTSHLRDSAPIFRFRIFRYLKEHHRLHHRPALMKDYNFNVVYPLADMMFGTMHNEKKLKQIV